MIICQELLDQLETTYQADFLIEVIFDWYALYQRVYGCPAKIAFETSWEIADEIMARLDAAPLVPGESPAYELIHEALLAAEKRVPADELVSALDAFFDALPCVQAAFVLFRASFKPSQPQVES